MVTGLPERKDYTYQGTGTSLSKEEAARRLANGRPAAVAPAGQPVITPGRPERFGPAPTLKGAVKVAGFPAQSHYPWREIAADGGVWKLDPATFLWRGKPSGLPSIRASAGKYAAEHGLKAKTVIDDGHLYVQFTRDSAR